MTISISSGIPGTRICAPRKMPFSSTSSPRIWLIASCRTASMRKPISFIDSITVSASTTIGADSPSDCADVRSNRQRENDGKRADHEAGTRLEDDMDLPGDVEPVDDAEDQVGQEQPAEQEGQDRDQIQFGIVAIVPDGRGQGRDQP